MNYKHFVHHDCSLYPCHTLDRWKSCLFCWCPLYLLDCGGCYDIVNGIKDCANCSIPHTEEGYDYILAAVTARIYQKQVHESITTYEGKAIMKANLQSGGGVDVIMPDIREEECNSPAAPQP